MAEPTDLTVIRAATLRDAVDAAIGPGGGGDDGTRQRRGRPLTAVVVEPERQMLG
jgi:hypothetical protein